MMINTCMCPMLTTLYVTNSRSFFEDCEDVKRQPFRGHWAAWEGEITNTGRSKTSDSIQTTTERDSRHKTSKFTKVSGIL